MYASLSEWGKEIRKALVDKGTNLQSVSEKIGYSYSVVTALISGRIVKGNYLEIAQKLNKALEVEILPKKPQLPSNEWCGAVRAKLFVEKMSISDLSNVIDFNRDRVSLVLNGHAMDEPVIEKINKLLKIEVPVVSTGSE